MSGLSKRRVQADAEGTLSLPDLNRILDDVDRILRDLDRRLEEGSDDHSANIRAIADISRVVGGNGGAAVVPTNHIPEVVIIARDDLEPTYDIGFVPDPLYPVMVTNRGLVLTPDSDYTITGDKLTLKPHQVPLNTEGHILVVATRS